MVLPSGRELQLSGIEQLWENDQQSVVAGTLLEPGEGSGTFPPRVHPGWQVGVTSCPSRCRDEQSFFYGRIRIVRQRTCRQADPPGPPRTLDRPRRSPDPTDPSPESATDGRTLVLPGFLRPRQLLLRKADGYPSSSPYRTPDRLLAARRQSSPPRQSRSRGAGRPRGA